QRSIRWPTWRRGRCRRQPAASAIGKLTSPIRRAEPMSRIAFIGLGNMGGPMAANLVKAGHAVHAYDLVPAALDAAVAAGASAAGSAQATLEGAEVVISMLPASRHVEGLYLGDDGILAGIPAGALVIDCSTIAPATARKVAAAAQARGLQMIDA